MMLQPHHLLLILVERHPQQRQQQQLGLRSPRSGASLPLGSFLAFPLVTPLASLFSVSCMSFKHRPTTAGLLCL